MTDERYTKQAPVEYGWCNDKFINHDYLIRE